MEIINKFLSLIEPKQISSNEEIQQRSENGKIIIGLFVKDHPYHDDFLNIAVFDPDNKIVNFYEQHRIVFQDFIEKMFNVKDDVYRLEQINTKIVAKSDIFDNIRASIKELIDKVKLPDTKSSDVKSDILNIFGNLKYTYKDPQNKNNETIGYLCDKLIKAIARKYTESWINNNNTLQISFEKFDEYCTYNNKLLSKELVKIKNNISGFGYGKQICEKAKLMIEPKYLSESNIEFKLNSDTAHSGVISLKNNPWRNGKINGDMLLIRIKAEGEKRFIYLKSSLSHLLDESNIEYSASPTEEKNGVIKVDLNIFKAMFDKEDRRIKTIINAAFLRAISFTEFGCCSKYEECEKQGKCLHTDQLYATACQWQKHLKKD